MTTFTFTPEMYEAQAKSENDKYTCAIEDKKVKIKRQVKAKQEYNLPYGQEVMRILVKVIEQRIKELHTLHNMHNSHFYWNYIKPLQNNKECPAKQVADIMAVTLVGCLSSELMVQNVADKVAQRTMDFLDIPHDQREGLKAHAVQFFVNLIYHMSNLVDVYTVEQVDGRECRIFLSEKWAEHVEIAKQNIATSVRCYAPMLVPPTPHTDLLSTKGGYLSNVSPVLKKPVRDSKGNIMQELKNFTADTYPKYFSFVNKMQSTPYCINVKGLRVFEQLLDDGYTFDGFPFEVNDDHITCEVMEGIKRRNNARKRYAEKNNTEYKPLSQRTVNDAIKVALREEESHVVKYNTLLDQANELAAEKCFFFPSFADSRSRFYPYATTGITYQGDELSKGLVQFANKQKLTKDGVDALMESLANALTNKKSLDTTYDRMVCEKKRQYAEAFFEEHMQDFMDGDFTYFPINQHKLDEPITAMMVCIELVEFMKDPEGYRCGYIAHRDARCSGASIIGTALQDKVIMEMTSVLPWSDENGFMGDLYTLVANKALEACEKLVSKGDELAIDLMAFKDDLFIRKVFKENVMCRTAYGSTDYALKQNNKNAFDWEMKLSFKHQQLFDKLMDTALKTACPASSAYLDAVQKAAKVAVARDGVVKFTSPFNGFPVVLTAEKEQTRRMAVRDMGRVVKLNLKTFTGGVDTGAIVRSAAPSVIHHIDSAVLFLVGQQMEGDLCFIHDSMATNINDTKKLVSAYAKAMCLVASSDPLNVILKQLDPEASLEKVGTCSKEDIRNILNATECIC